MFKLGSLIVGGAIIQKLLLAFMARDDYARMFNRAKILLSARHDFTDIGNHASVVGAITAVEFFDTVKLAKRLPIKNNVIATADFFNSVNPKTADLIKS